MEGGGMKTVCKSLDTSKHPVSVALGLVALRRFGLYAQVAAVHKEACDSAKPIKENHHHG
jgi:hypothetical protein